MRFAILLAAVLFFCPGAASAAAAQPPQGGKQTAQPAKPENKSEKQAAAKTAIDKVAFTATDVCSKTFCEVRYDVKAMGDKVYVEMTYVKNAAALGRRDGSTATMILDLEHNTIKYLDTKRKLYSVQNSGGLRGTPLAKIIAALRAAPDVAAFEKDAKLHGTMAETPTVDTTIAHAEQNAAFNERILEVPGSYKRLREDGQRGSIGGSGFPGTVYTGGGR